PLKIRRSGDESRDRRTPRRASDLAGIQAAGAHLHLDDLPLRSDDPRDLEIRLPRAARLVVRVGHIVPERDTLAAGITTAAIDWHFLILHELDASHLGTIALP